MFSTSCDYGLQAMLFLALHYHEEENIDLTTISKKLDIPKHFLSKVLQLLVKHKLLVSMKGPTGGFRLNRTPSDITLIEIIEAIDGLDIFNECGIGFKKCNDDNPCPIHNEYKEVRNNVQDLFETKTLKELTEDVKRGESIVSLGHKISSS
ncbi:RrF2 family transcriptional regulator [Fodinibius saliphilus]|uniref:RrF2 family transcriptional regulator n=1 Tax=Fodinibius saliphilus TaxID=1920650 RepID=UPI0011086E0A|nr:Rrf2 family transcriptional regulator [Fodinibius saliphilus]